MLTKENVIDALKHVQDPELNRSIVELNMVRNVQIMEGHVSLEVVLTIQGCPLKAKIQEDIENSLRNIGALSVALKFGSMTKEERETLTKVLKGNATTETGMPKMLAPDSGVNFIAITSGKGIYGFSVPAMMGITQKPTMIDQTVIPVESHGVKVMSMGFFAADDNPVMWRGPMLNKWIKNFLVNTHWGELDYMLLDLPPGTGDVAIDVAAMIPQGKEVIVTTPHNVASYVASRAGAMAKHTKHEIVGVIENMAYFEEQDGSKNYLFGKGGGEMLAKRLDTEVIATIPFSNRKENNDANVFDEESYIGETFASLAEDLVNQS